MKDDSAGKQEIVLRLVEEAGANIIGFSPEGHTGVPAVIRPAAQLHRKRIAARHNLRTLVRAAKNPVQPRLPSLLAPDDLGAAAVEAYSRVLAGTDASAECAG